MTETPDFDTLLANGWALDKDETALAVLALLACVSHRLERGDFVNCRTCWTIETFSI